MIGFWIRISVIFILTCLQAAYIGIFNTAFFSVNILLLLVLAWMLVLGFSRAVGWILLVGFVFDVLFFLPVGASMALFISIGYVMSTLTRQFLSAYAFWEKMFIIGMVILATTMEGIFHLFFLWFGQSAMHASMLDGKNIILEWITVVGIHLLLFPVVFVIISRLEKYLSFYERRNAKNYV